MLALASVWLGLITLLLSVVMVLYRPAMTDWTVTLVLYFGSPGSLCFAGMTLWAYRKEDAVDPGVAARRTQAKIAIALSVLATALIYTLIIQSVKFVPIDDSARAFYNPSGDRAIAGAPITAWTSCKSRSTDNPRVLRKEQPWRICSASSTWNRFAWPSRSTRTSFPAEASANVRFARGIASRS